MAFDRLGSSAADTLAAFVASVADAVYAVDSAGAVQYVNPAGLEVLGYDDEAQLLGRPSHATIHHHHVDGRPYPADECPLLRPLATGETVRVDEDWFVRRDGSFVPVAYSSAPIDTQDGRGAVVVFQDITQRRELEQARRDEQAERARAQALHASRARIVEATLDERRRLGRDLHDGAQQRLVNVVIALQLALRQTTAPQAGELIGQALADTRQSIEDLRALAAGLLPAVLVHHGLRAAIDTLAAQAPVPVTLAIDDARYGPVVEATAYFFVAEALTNVAKHAGASSVSIRVAREGDTLVVEVSDDGRGGAGDAGPDALSGLRDRVAAIGGSVAVDSPPGAGTRLRAELPVSSPAAA